MLPRQVSEVAELELQLPDVLITVFVALAELVDVEETEEVVEVEKQEPHDDWHPIPQ